MQSVRIGHRIKYYRQRQGITQMELAERIGVSYQQVQKYENDRSQITLQRLYGIADALETSVLSLLAEGGAGRVSEKQSAYTPQGGRVGKTSREQQLLLQLFSRISNPKLRRCILGLLESIAEQRAGRRA
ncbi:MAG: helix-turn-helix domain-containing protein [Spirochaetia bacterium]